MSGLCCTKQKHLKNPKHYLCDKMALTMRNTWKLTGHHKRIWVSHRRYSLGQSSSDRNITDWSISIVTAISLHLFDPICLCECIHPETSAAWTTVEDSRHMELPYAHLRSFPCYTQTTVTLGEQLLSTV